MKNFSRIVRKIIACGFNGSLQRHLAMQMVIILTSYVVRLSYCAFAMSVTREPIRVSHAFVKKNMIRYIKPHRWFAHCSCETLVLASCIEIYNIPSSRPVFKTWLFRRTIQSSRVLVSIWPTWLKVVSPLILQILICNFSVAFSRCTASN